MFSLSGLSVLRAASVARTVARSSPNLAALAVRPLHQSTTLKSATNPANAHGLSHWKVERVLSVALIGLVPAAFVAPCAVVNHGLAIVLPLHNYLGMDAVITDYVHGAATTVVKGTNLVLHVATIAGLIYFNMNDVGICEGMKTLWSL